jgi:5-deoxy-glucuronate isomerase
MDDKFYLGDGTAREGAFSLPVTPELAGWAYCGLGVLDLAPGGSHTWSTGEDEILVLPLNGAATVSCDGQTFELQGRSDVFSRVSDFCYVPPAATLTVTGGEGGRFAIPATRCTRRLTPRYSPAEAELEEIYYFETQGLAYQRVYGTQARPITVLAEVVTGDVVLVPHGWHGPSMAAPGYHLYYLNVMAGPSAERAWRFCNDPAHAWIRGTWSGQDIDPRLPLTSATERKR